MARFIDLSCIPVNKGTNSRLRCMYVCSLEHNAGKVYSYQTRNTVLSITSYSQVTGCHVVMASFQMLRQFWQFFLVLVMIFFSPFRLFLSMWYQSNLKFNNGTLPVSKLNAVRPVTLAHNSVTDKNFTAIWNRSFPHCPFFLSFFFICFS